jgi:hypothetical protein
MAIAFLGYFRPFNMRTGYIFQTGVRPSSALTDMFFVCKDAGMVFEQKLRAEPNIAGPQACVRAGDQKRI